MATSKANLDVEKARLETERDMIARLKRNRRVLLVLSAAVVILLLVTIAVFAKD